MNQQLRIRIPVASAAFVAAVATAQPALAETTLPQSVRSARSAQLKEPPGDRHLNRQERKNRVAARKLLKIAFDQHKPRKAARRYISGRVYIQHNPNFGNGRKAFITGVRAYIKQFPKSSLKTKRTVTQGRFVVAHSRSRLDPKDRGTAVVDIYRFNRKGKIVEHWDVLQKIADKSKNGNPQV